MPDLTAKRTLVKSPPELWEELSEVERLARHLDAFGEIRITRLEPEHTVAWEGEHGSGTVSIEPSGWGTKVVLRAEVEADVHPTARIVREDGEPEALGDEPESEAEKRQSELAEPPTEIDEPASEPDHPVAGGPAISKPPDGDVAAPARRRWRGFWARLFSGWLVPEERLNRAAAAGRPAPEVNRVDAGTTVEEPSDETPAPEPEKSADTTSRHGDTADTAAAGPAPADQTPAEAETSRREPDADPAPSTIPAIDPERAEAVLQEVLDALGSAHHRPFSRG